jgi:hypothetical protein
MEPYAEKQTPSQSVPPTPGAQPQAGSPPPLPEPRSKPAAFPPGFWARIDYLLHHPEEVIESLRADAGLWELARIFFAISLYMAALYGAVMGATGLLQGTGMPMKFKLLTIVGTAVKVPVLYLVTLAIVLPPIYVSNAFVGARLKLRQMIACVLGALAVTVTALGSMATIAAFFALTSKSYDFIKLLHVVIFAYAGLSGLSYLVRCMRVMLPTGRKGIPQGLFVLWFALYMFVGTQMAWVLRPFVGSPGMDFELFRPRTGNFYESVAFSIRDLFRKD